MSKYKMVITWSKEDGAFLVEVPELPGCMSDGRTREEAVDNAERVIQEWIGMANEMGREVPEPDAMIETA